MTRSIDQKIAEAEAKLARLRQQSRQLENGQKIILGGMLLNAAKKDQKIREWLINEAVNSITREADKNRISPLIDELRKININKDILAGLAQESINKLEI